MSSNLHAMLVLSTMAATRPRDQAADENAEAGTAAASKMVRASVAQQLQVQRLRLKPVDGQPVCGAEEEFERVSSHSAGWIRVRGAMKKVPASCLVPRQTRG